MHMRGLIHITMKQRSVAEWLGNMKDGCGWLTSDSLVPISLAYRDISSPSPNATNSAELVAAAQAVCFSTFLVKQLNDSGLTTERVRTEATVNYERVSGEWAITGTLLEVIARVPSANSRDLIRAALRSKLICPVCKLLNVNTDMAVTLDR